MFKNKELVELNAQMTTKIEELETQLENYSSEQLEAVNTKLTEANAELAEVKASLEVYESSAALKDAKIEELTASQESFDAKLDAAVSAEVAKLGEQQPIEGNASTGKTNIELNAEYSKLQAGAERAAWVKANPDFKLITH